MRSEGRLSVPEGRTWVSALALPLSKGMTLGAYPLRASRTQA